jgi:hypothetical protein
MSVATETRPDLDTLREQEASMVQELEGVKAWLAEQPEKQRAAREEAFLTIGKRPLALTNSPPQKLIDAEKKAVAKARSLEADLAAVRSVIAAETQRQAEEVLADVHERDDRERDRQAELIPEAAAAFTDLVEAYSRLLQAAEKHDRGRERRGRSCRRTSSII